MPSDTSLFAAIRNHIARDEVTDGLKLMRALLENTPQLNDVLNQSGRLASIRKQLQQGTVSRENAAVTENQIRYSVLQLLSDIEEEGIPGLPLDQLLQLVEKESTRPELQKEIQAAISIVGSKNVVAGSSISAGGNVHIGDIIHQTVAAPAATAPQHDFNKLLTRTLVEAMQPYHDKAARLSKDFSWLEHPDNLRKVQQFVFRNFVGEIGKQLRNLVNIGVAKNMDAAQQQQHYCKKCLDIAKRTLDLLNFSLLSQWWEAVKITPRTPNPNQKQILSDFFKKDLEYPLARQFAQLCMLRSLFLEHELPLPFAELQDLNDALSPDSSLQQACEQLEQMAATGDCAQAEAQLAEILRHFAFLTRYRMVSIKRIGYRQIRNGQPEYLHRYVALGIDVKYSEDAEKGNWISVGEQTPAVMLFEGHDYREGINLFPFVIDMNALTFEQGARICFFSTKDLDNEQVLEYRFLGDNSLERIEKKGILRPDTNLSELMMDDEKLKILNLDCVVDTFMEASKAILAEGEDFFDDL